jgi:hypothetical protein
LDFFSRRLKILRRWGSAAEVGRFAFKESFVKEKEDG